MDVMIVVKSKGFSGLKEFTQHLKDNLNFRPWEIDNYTKYRLFGGYSGTNIYRLSSAVTDSEIIKYLDVFFGLSNEDARNVLNTLVELGFLRVAYENNEWSPKWVNDSSWRKLIEVNC